MRNELVFKNHENGYKVAKILLDEGKVVMLSYEEEFLVLNWEWCESGYADRNEVVFMPRDEFDEKYCEIVDEDESQENLMNDITKDYLNGTLGAVLAPRIAKFKNDITSIGKQILYKSFQYQTDESNNKLQ